MGALRESVLHWIKPIHKRLRDQKLDLFFGLIGAGPAGTLLDLGGGTGIAGEFLRLYAAFSSVTVVNLEPLVLDLPPHIRVQAIVANGCALPFPSGAFDWVFSNAVIEHVGRWDKQELFANEVRRLAAKGYFVATPNKYFPVEPHTLLPFYQFLPPRLQRRVVRFSPGYLRGYEEIHLLTPPQLRSLFPGAEIRSVGFPIFGNSLIALYRAK